MLKACALASVFVAVLIVRMCAARMTAADISALLIVAPIKTCTSAVCDHWIGCIRFRCLLQMRLPTLCSCINIISSVVDVYQLQFHNQLQSGYL